MIKRRFLSAWHDEDVIVDFSRVFNTIRPALMGEKLTAMQVDAALVSWVVDHLTDRPQYVRLTAWSVAQRNHQGLSSLYKPSI